MFARLKRFFSRIKTAIKELIWGEEKTVEVTSYSETEYNDDGTVKSEKRIEVVNPNGTWRDIGRKISNKIKEGVNWIIDNPKKAFGWLTLGGGGMAVVLSNVERVQRMIDKHQERRDKRRVMYDNRNNAWNTAKRPLTTRELNHLNLERAKGRAMSEVLAEMGLA